MKAIAKAGVGDGEGGAQCLEDVAKQFQHWRQSRVWGEHIPVALWGQAVQMCQEHEPQRVAGELGVELASLMRRVQRAGAIAAHRPSLDTEFVELIMTTASPATPETAASKLAIAPTPGASMGALRSTPASECVLELENAHGAKMRVQLNGAGLASLGALCSSFWSAT